MKLRAATRSSPLARWQTEHIAGLLRGVDPTIEVELVLVDTTGDRNQSVPLHLLGGQGVFVKEVQAAVLDGRADLAVHSAKDLPARATPGLTIAAVPERGDPRDALVGRSLAALAPGAVVATGAVRRRAQLAARRPDLVFVELRGNIATRLAKVPENGAIVMAYAALQRLDQGHLAADVLDPAVMLPQVGQGALAVECVEASAVGALLARIEHAPSRACIDAERSFLAGLGSGCDLPVGAYATVAADGLRLTGLVAAPDGSRVIRRTGTGTDPVALGLAVCAEVLAAGGRSLLGDGE